MLSTRAKEYISQIWFPALPELLNQILELKQALNVFLNSVVPKVSMEDN